MPERFRDKFYLATPARELEHGGVNSLVKSIPLTGSGNRGICDERKGSERALHCEAELLLREVQAKSAIVCCWQTAADLVWCCHCKASVYIEREL